MQRNPQVGWQLRPTNSGSHHWSWRCKPGQNLRFKRWNVKSFTNRIDPGYGRLRRLSTHQCHPLSEHRLDGNLAQRLEKIDREGRGQWLLLFQIRHLYRWRDSCIPMEVDPGLEKVSRVYRSIFRINLPLSE